MLYASAVQGVIDAAVENQVYQIILPFVLVFLVAFVFFKASKIVEESWIAGVLAGVIALLATLFLAAVPIVGDFLSFFLGKAGLILVIVLIILVVNAFINNKMG
jgi:hypothetical protein